MKQVKSFKKTEDMKKITLILALTLTSLLTFASDDYRRFAREIDAYSRGYSNEQVMVLYQNHYGIPQSTLLQLFGSYGHSWGNVVLSLEISHFLGAPIGDVYNVYTRGNGWGVIAQQYGIKPGSAEFHRMKSVMGKKSKYWKGIYMDYGRNHNPIISRKNRIFFDDGMLIFGPSHKEIKKIEKQNKKIYKNSRKQEKAWEKQNEKFYKEQRKQQKRYEKW